MNEDINKGGTAKSSNQMIERYPFVRVVLYGIYTVIFLNSFFTNRIASIPAAQSAIGAANMTPSTPMNRGKMITRGMRKIICLVIERKIPFVAFPMEVKKFAVTGCSPLKKVQNRKIRKNLTAN